MLKYIKNREKILSYLKHGLTNKGHSFKILSGINRKLELLLEIKNKYNFEILRKIIESTNYSILENIENVSHGLNNVNNIDGKKSDWFFYVINKNNIKEKDTIILRESFSSKETLIYETEKFISGKCNEFYCIFSKIKYENKQEYIANRWQER